MKKLFVSILVGLIALSVSMTTLKSVSTKGDLVQLSLPGVTVWEGDLKSDGVQLYSIRAYGIVPWLVWVQNMKVLDSWDVRVLPHRLWGYLAMGLCVSLVTYGLVFFWDRRAPVVNR